ncbi:hypothetical protein B0T21DRAFT_287866 [Apiosordaria backusii]|uniref:BHLH domain-containing protein n=1 Tax=Apiosordaria backusii TaxID=314023 RepID=A0AA40BP40_9PEZI|nr:hypothetical protein B0T21DRAFT_287866 [Apiosordaria backusii]
MNGHGGNGGIDPNDLSMAGNFGSSFQNNNFAGGHANTNTVSNAFLNDDDLLDGLTGPSPTDPQAGLHGQGQDFGGMDSMGGMAFSHGVYSSSHHGLPIGDNYSSTPDGDPIQSPFVHQFSQYRQMQHPQSFGVSMQSPLSYTAELNEATDPNFLKTRPRMPQAMQRKPSATRGPLTPKAAAMGLSIGSDSAFGAQPIRTAGAHHEKSHSGQWMGTPNSMSSFPGSGFSSPLGAGMHSAQINDMLLKGGASMPAKIGAPASTAEAKKKKRRESHNLVERRRRDNINERIQDLSKLVPTHRLEDEKVRKAIQNGGTPMSPDGGTPGQATSSLAGPGARRAAGGTAGSITTGLPMEEKDKGPNKGDILNGSVGWMRDLMWLVEIKIHQVEELSNALLAAGIKLPFEITEEEQRMQSEVLDMVSRDTPGTKFTYSRFDGSGLRVPDFTDYAGKKLNNANAGTSGGYMPMSPNNGVGGHDMLDTEDFLDYDDDENDNGAFKEEAEYGGMDMS